MIRYKVLVLFVLWLVLPRPLFSQNDTLYYRSQLFVSQPVPVEVQARMNGKSMPEKATIGYAELRYLTFSYYDFEGNIQLGEMVCNKAIARDLLSIFRILFAMRYPICSIRLIDDFDASDEASMQANNTSCFNYRTVPGTSRLSRHAKGMAVDINPLQNPFIYQGKVHPANATEYVDRSKDFPHKIDKKDFCKRLFTSYGFQWGGDWYGMKDYQHFEK